MLLLRKYWMPVAVGAAVLVIGIAVIVGRSSADKASTASASSPSGGAGAGGTRPDGGPAENGSNDIGTTPDGGSSAAAGGSSGDAANGGHASGQNDKRGTPPTTKLPVSATAGKTEGLHDGDAVSVHVVADPGSQAFAFEAWLCKGGATIRNDSDLRPSQGGNCLPEPLSAVSEYHITVQGQPPFSSVDGSIRVGVGSKTFKAQDGRSVTISCGPGSPCTIALKLQFPDGFGFRAFPITFA